MLRANKHRNTHLQNSWNKYGESNFKFDIVEKCSKNDCIIREQHFIDTLKPEYNMLKTAGSVLGYRHTTKTKHIIGLASKGKNSPAYSGEYVFYNPSYGYFIGSLVDFAEKYNFPKSVGNKLKLGHLSKSHGWIYVCKSTEELPNNITSFYTSRIFNNKPIFHFIHDDGINFIGRRSEFSKLYHIDRSSVSKLILKKRAKIFGWKLIQ